MSLATNKNRFQNLLTALAFTFAVIFFVSCSTESYTQEEDKTLEEEKTKQKKEQALYFTENENGNKTEYEVHFKDGEITSIHKNGVKVPDDEIEGYEDLVNDELNSIRRDKFDFFVHPSPHAFHFDMDEFHKNMDEMRDNFKGDNFVFKFDREKFKEDMDKLKDDLKDIDDIVIHIDKDKIRKNIDKGLRDLDKLKMHRFNFDFDDDELDENMKRITIELKNMNDELELNMENLEEEMKDLEEEMGDLSKEMEELDKEMKNLDNFLSAVKIELVKDGLIKNTEVEFELELSSTKMEVNDEKIPDNLLEKYKALYEKHFGKEIKGKLKFQN